MTDRHSMRRTLSASAILLIVVALSVVPARGADENEAVHSDPVSLESLARGESSVPTTVEVRDTGDPIAEATLETRMNALAKTGDAAGLKALAHANELFVDVDRSDASVLVLHPRWGERAKRFWTSIMPATGPAAVERAIAAGEDLDAPIVTDDGPTTLVHEAVTRDDLVSLSRLLDAGADPDRPSPRPGGIRPLEMAAYEGRHEAARALVEAGAYASVALHDPWGNSLLTAAVLDDDHEAVSLLLARGADPDLADGVGYTALAHAVGRRDEAMIDLLLAESDPRATVRCVAASDAPDRDLGNDCDVLDIARTLGSPPALIERLETRVRALGGEDAVIDARADIARVQALRDGGDPKAPADVLDGTLDALAPESLDASSDADAVTIAMAALLRRHELALVLAEPFESRMRDRLAHLEALWTWTGPAHALLDAVDAYVSTGAPDALDLWVERHGTVRALEETVPEWDATVLERWAGSLNDPERRARAERALARLAPP